MNAYPLTEYNDYLSLQLSYSSRRLYICYLRKILRELDRRGVLDEALTADLVLSAVDALPETAQKVAKTAYRTWVDFCTEENDDSLKHGGEGCWVPPALPLKSGSVRTPMKLSDRAAVAARVVLMEARKIRRISVRVFATIEWGSVTVEPSGAVAVVPSYGAYHWGPEAVPAWRVLEAETRRSDADVLVMRTEDAVRAVIRRGDILILKKQHLDLVPDSGVVVNPTPAPAERPVLRHALDYDNPHVAIMRGFRCSVCGRPEWTTPAGEVCRAGHRGEFEPGVPTEDDVV